MTPSQPRTRRADRLSHASRDWLRYRNWTGDPGNPRLGNLGVQANNGGYSVVNYSTSPPSILSTCHEPEHAQRYVEHVHNYGRPPH